MALQVETPKREFVAEINGEKQTLPDPNPSFSPEEVRKHYAALHGELTNAAIEGPKATKDGVSYSIITKAGTKG